MHRRTFVTALLVFVTLACAAPAASAYVPLFTATVAPRATLAPGAGPAVTVWPAAGDTQLLAQQWSNAGGPQPVRTVTTGISALGAWYAAANGAQVTVAWQDGGTVWARCIDVSTGSAVFGPVEVCTDTAVSALEGAATDALLSGIAPDGAGGAYVWCTATPSRGVTGYGDSLLNHISPGGILARSDPGLPVAKGTISGLAAGDDGHAFLLLAPPGRNSIATQRFAPTLTPDWVNPISPYSPLVRPPGVTRTPIAVTAGSGAMIAWREGTKVKVQRYPAGGGVTWLDPPAVTMAGVVRLASDGLNGAFLAGPSGAGIRVSHVLSSGSVSTSTLGVPGLTRADVGAMVVNRAGDLFVGYGDLDAPGTAGVGLFTFVGGFTAIGPATMLPDQYGSGAPDGAGGAYLAGDTIGTGYLVREGPGPGRYVTLRPRALSVLYGKSVTASGYVTLDGVPVSGAAVAVTTPTGGAGTPPPAAQTGADGYFRVTLSPKANATWTATSGDGSSTGVRIEVRPKVAMTMSHLRGSTRLSEIFSGSVSPGHRGAKVLVQKAVGSGWRTVATGKLDSRSRYRVTWYVPYRSATYKLRVILPAHADHAQGTSRTGTLKVVIRRG